MTPYPLAPLLRLREFRQEKAMIELQACERRLIEARKEVKKAVRQHEEFLDWLAGEEERRYREIMGKNMTLEDVDEFKAGLLEIRARESRYLENILKAENQVQICEDNVARAKNDLLRAQKGTMKIEVHRERWLEMIMKEAERAEELELEDFMPKKDDLFEEMTV